MWRCDPGGGAGGGASEGSGEDGGLRNLSSSLGPLVPGAMHGVRSVLLVSGVHGVFSYSYQLPCNMAFHCSNTTPKLEKSVLQLC